jgi:methionyl-tRNA formyltransferase
VSPAPAPRPRVVFVGSGRFGSPALAMLAAKASERDASIDLVAVVTAPPRPAGRHHRAAATPIALLAERLGIGPVLAPQRLRLPDAVAEVGAVAPDLLVVADYGQVVPPALLGLAHGALNLHPSRLPRHRGASPIAATILAGDRDTAVTIIRMDAGVDTGPIVAVSEPIPVGDDATAPELEDLLAAEAGALLERTLPAWLDGAITALPQPSVGVTSTALLHREDGRLDPSRPALELERRVRAYRPWPGTFLEAEGGERVGVLRAAVAASEPEDREGRLVEDRGGLALATADGRLRLIELQPAGGRPMPADAFMLGRPGLIGREVVGAGGTMAGR